MPKGIFKEGFTLVELSLSIAFIGVLSISIVLIISNTIASYRRGLTLNQVNTIGMEIVENIRTTIHNSSSKMPENLCTSVYNDESDSSVVAERKKCLSDGARNFVSVTKYADIKINGEYEATSLPVYGAFCTGSYSYIWNSGYFDSENADMNEIEPAKFIFTDKNNQKIEFISTEGKTIPFKLIRVVDNRRDVCVSVAQNQYSAISGIDGGFDVSGFGILDESPEELIGTGDDNDLAIYDLSVGGFAESKMDNNLFYSISFILGTVQGGADIRSRGKSCSAPNDYGEGNFDYCAINKFNFAVQANGE